MWFLMLWAVSPLALIPLLVHFYNKAGRLEKFIDRLHQQGRIDNNEYYQTTRRLPKGVAPGQMSGAVPPPVQGVGAPPPYVGAPNMPPPPQYVPQGRPVTPPPVQQPIPQPMQQMPMPQPAPQPVQQPVYAQQTAVPQGAVPPVPPPMPPYPPAPQKAARSVSSSSVMLMVGVILVSIAGLIFATAVWTSMGGAGRTGTIAFAAAFFYIISAFSVKKLSLENSSNAFFSLGAVFTLITYLTAGYYELFGAELSFDGGHKLGLVSGACALTAALSVIGYRIYKRKYLAVISVSGVFAAYELLAFDLAGGRAGITSFMSSLALAGCLAVVMLIKGKPDWAADTLRVCAGLAGILSAASPFLKHFGEWRAADMLTAAVLFSIISLYSFKLGSKPMLSLHSVFMGAAALSACVQLFEDDAELYSAFFAFAALGLLYRGFAALRTPVSDNIFAIALAVTLLAMLDIEQMSLVPALCGAVLVLYMCIFAFDKKPYSKVYCVTLPLPFIFIAACFDGYLYDVCDVDTGSYSVLALLLVYALAAAALIYITKKPQKLLNMPLVANAFAAAAAICSIFAAVGTDKGDTAERLLALLAVLLTFAAVYAGDLQPLSLFPAIKTAPLFCMGCESLFTIGSKMESVIGALASFALFAALSRVLFSKCVYVNINGKPKLDTFAVGAATAVIALFSRIDPRTSVVGNVPSIAYLVPVLAWGCLAALLLLLIREKNHRDLNSVLGVCGAAAVYASSLGLVSFASCYIKAELNLGTVIAAVIVFVCFCILSRVIFSRELIIKGANGILPDFFAAAAAAALVRLYSAADSMAVRAESYQTYETEMFIAWLAAGVFALILIREKNSERLNTVLKLLSSGAWLVAFIERPFLVSDSETVEIKVTVVAVAVFGFAAKYILRKNEKLSENFATAVHVFAMILLIGDALTHQSLLNTLIVMSVAAGVMVVSFIIKRKRWFIISAAMLVGLTLYICKDFLASISWWVYLLVIGATLIVIAVSNEYFKNKNEQAQPLTEKKKGRLFEEWKW